MWFVLTDILRTTYIKDSILSKRFHFRLKKTLQYIPNWLIYDRLTPIRKWQVIAGTNVDHEPRRHVTELRYQHWFSIRGGGRWNQMFVVGAAWYPMPCEKHGPRDSVDKNRGRRPRFLSLLRPEGHVFHTAWETMIKSYYSTLTDWFWFSFCSQKLEFQRFKMDNLWLTSRLLRKSRCCYALVAKGHKWIIVMKTWIPALLD